MDDVRDGVRVFDADGGGGETDAEPGLRVIERERLILFVTDGELGVTVAWSLLRSC